MHNAYVPEHHLARELAQHAQELGRMQFPPRSIHYIVMAYMDMPIKVLAYPVTACVSIAYIVTARVLMAYICGPIWFRVHTTRVYPSIGLA